MVWLIGLAILFSGGITSAAELLQSSNLVYMGAFRVPDTISGGAGFAYARTGLAYNPANNSLFINNHIYEQKTAEISIPQPVKGINLSDLNMASVLQNLSDITEGHLSDIAAGGAVYPSDTGVYMGGLMVYGNKLIGTSYGYYDAGNVAVLSHFTSGLNLSQTGDFRGMYKVGTIGQGFVSGPMTQIPPEWQAALGGTALTGNCCLSIIGRTSLGPAGVVFNPDDLGVKSPVPATPVLYYDITHPTLGTWEGDETVNLYFNMTTEIRGVIFPPGSRSVLYIGRQGTGVSCYGTATSDPSLAGKEKGDGSIYCYNPEGESVKGGHAYPYKTWVWAYDVNDMISVKTGQKNPWDIRPYAVWPLEIGPHGIAGVLGAAYDSTTKRLFISQRDGERGFPDSSPDNARPLIHVFSVMGGLPLDPAPPTPPGGLVVK